MNEYVNVNIAGLTIEKMKVIESRRDGFCMYHLRKYKAGQKIAYKHRDNLTPEQKTALFGNGTVYDLTFIWPLEKSSSQTIAKTLPAESKKKWDWPLSEFQENIWQKLIKTTKHIFIKALAGCAKTSSLIRFSKDLGKLGFTRGKQCYYLAFNASIRKEVYPELAGTGVRASTTHSFLLNKVLKRAFPDLDTDNCINDYRTDDAFFEVLCGDLNFSNSEQGRREARKHPKAKMYLGVVELVGLIKGWAVLPTYDGSNWVFSEEQQKRVIDLVDEYRIVLEEDYTEEDYAKMAMRVAAHGIPHPGQIVSEIDFNDMLWLPLVLNLPFPKVDLILTDESQDFNACQQLAIQKLIALGTRVVVVGDEFQCVTEGTEILTQHGSQPIEGIRIGDKITAACGDGKITWAKVTGVNKKLVNQEVVVIKTKSGKTIKSTPDHTHFAGYIKEPQKWHYTYLMYKEGLGYRVGVTRNNRIGKVGPGLRLNQEYADKMWLLGAFETETEARYHEQFYSVKYGLPTWLFRARNDSDISYKDDDIARLFSSIDTYSSAAKLLKDLGMHQEYPHYTPKCVTTDKRKRVRNFIITLCGDPRNGSMHRYAVSGSDPLDAAKLAEAGLKVRSSKNGGWRIEGCAVEMEVVFDIARKIGDIIPLNVIEKAALSNRTLPYTPASHVLPGMMMYTLDGEVITDDEVVSVTTEAYEGWVYDLNIERYHNFVANGIVTHNCIYRFRGADCRAFENISNMLQATKRGVECCDLPLNYRCDQAIIEHAQQWVPDIRGFSKERGIVQDVFLGSTIKEALKNDRKSWAFLGRTTAPLVASAFYTMQELLKTVRPEDRKSVCIMGRNAALGPLRSIITNLCGKEPECGIADKMNSEGKVVVRGFLTRLSEYRNTQVAKLGNNPKYALRLEEIVNNCQCLEVVAVTVTDDDVRTILKQLDTLFVEDVSDPEKTIVFSTVHRAKGLEWDTVRVIRPDLLPHPLAMPNEDGSWSDEQQQEENCCYIAATRARHDLGYVRDWPFDQSGKRLDLVSVTQSSVPLGIKPEMDPFASMPEEGMTWTPPPVRSSTPTRRATDVMGPAPRRPELQEEVLRAEYEAECEEHLRDFDLDFDDPEHDEDLDGGSNGYNPGFVESPALAKRITPPPAPVPPPRVIPPTPKSFVDDGEPF